MDIKKLTVVGEATGLYRLRIGDRRCVYATILEERFVVLLVIDERGAGYDRILGTALRRLSRFLA